MPRSATGVAGILSQVASAPPGQAALVALTLSRLRLAMVRGSAANGAVEVARRARFLADRDESTRARQLLRRAARVLEGRKAQAVIAVEDAILALDAGQLPHHGEERAVAGATIGDGQETTSADRAGDGALPASARRALVAVLAEADAAWEAHHDGLTEELLDMALRLVFHPRLHFSAAPSALTADPAGFLAPLAASTAWAAVTASLSGDDQTTQAGGAVGHDTAAEAATDTVDGDLSTVVAGHAPQAPDGEQAGGPRHLLVISLKNWTFVRGIVEDYRHDERCEVDTLDLADLPTTPSRRNLLHARLTLARGGDPRQTPGLGLRLPDDVVDTLSWADTIWVEWGSAAAVWTSLLAPTLAPDARLLVRLHSYEASTAMPQLIEWGAVDTLVTVAPAIREILHASLDLPATLTVTTVPNRAALTRFHLPKEPDAARTLALVGWAALRKDPAWALDVLDLLRAADPAWRLLLIGPDFPETLPADERAYAEAVTSRIREAGEAVTITGRTEEVPDHLRHVAVILSSSRREGTHEGFIEGTSSGALPVVRDWPDVARWGGPAALFPEDWVVRSPQDAADRIRALVDDAAYREAQASWMIERADWSHVRPRYDALILG